jgi:hypothetical protein
MRSLVHSPLCDWNGEAKTFTWKPGKCPACDIMKVKKIKGMVKSKTYYGIGKEHLHMFCLSGIKSARCTKHTNPSCACGKLVLNATA